MNINAHLSQASNLEQIDENLNNFTLIMQKVCDPLFSRNVHSATDYAHMDTDQPPKQPWFDDECRWFRKSFYSSLNFYRVDHSLENQTRLVMLGHSTKNFYAKNVTIL